MRVTWAAHDSAEALKLCEAEVPDVVLTELYMPGMDGIEATRRITQRFPRAAVLVLTNSSDEGDVLRAVRAGARGYLLKSCSLEELDAAVRSVHGGATVTPSDILKGALDVRRGVERPSKKLTVRETEVLRAVAMGKGNKEIAESLHISERTVRNHIYNTYKKLGVGGRMEAALYAFREGIAEVGGPSRF